MRWDGRSDGTADGGDVVIGRCGGKEAGDRAVDGERDVREGLWDGGFEDDG